MTNPLVELQKKLDEPLDQRFVRQREHRPGLTLDYVEGWYVIHRLNQLFPLGWERSTELLRLEVQEATSQRGKRWEAAALARVRLVIHLPGGGTIARDGIGSGSGIAARQAEAVEDAAKEAETDALKRAAVTLGMSLGLALYDRSREHVVENGGSREEETAPATTAPEWAKDAKQIIDTAEAMVASATTADELRAFMATQLPDGQSVATWLREHAPETYDRIVKRGLALKKKGTAK